METVAQRYLSTGDLKSAATFYCNLMLLHPRYAKMARVCRVLANPLEIPQPHRYANIVEALLEPSITHQAIFGADATPTVIKKVFQQWTLLVHPDKNPYPKAGEAFNRLVALKAAAVEMSKNIQREPNVSQCGSHGDGCQVPQGGARINKSVAQSSSSGNADPLPGTDEIDISLSRLKSLQVTLKSLKRKNLDDSELPQLSKSLRKAREPCFDLDDSVELARTTPALRTAETLQRRSFPQKPPFPRRTQTWATPPRPDQGREVSTSSVGLAEVQEVESSSRDPSDITSHKLEEDIIANEAGVHEETVAAPWMVDVPPNTRNGGVEYPDAVGDRTTPAPSADVDVELTQENEVNCKDMLLRSPDEPSTSSVKDPFPSRSGEDIPVGDLLKLSAKELFCSIQRRINREPLRLKCDLSFAAYEREKLMRETSISENESLTCPSIAEEEEPQKS
ncbi:hypothetical protein ERJ75_000744900 [Trypanosoma vivax]|uniref:J domain-containing protein n=1 Tax=Trypanosoma vivax (strain Y486) TaxID=1055687 RepID=G0TYT9_TRYVY|nr:hypothetical protein TRVL_08636 [Trypanosoma vivax]KAH8613973.1 hypothetical protein ERJ75_000744900 [Trypanosoma vivax]CCC49139.1 conserved hypothetical protein [Trypanosoma vivax Y486]